MNFIKNREGQISVMIGIMLMTFFLFFAFIVNTGMLVNAKINLQSAADLAAYAGAATQARQLTQISYLNYEMRRQWKKFLYRIYVLGNMAEDDFPRSPGPSSAAPHLHGVPATCIAFNQNDNFCHLQTKKLSKISYNANPASLMMDAIAGTLASQLQNIEEIRKSNCVLIGMTNKILNILWLFNTDPDLVQMTSNQSDPSIQNVLQIIQGIAHGVGIVPRELILKYRIQTLKDYVNYAPQTGLTKNTTDGLLQSSDPAAAERPIQAFYSAYYTLGNHTYDPTQISLDELIPSGATNSANLIGLKEINAKFDTYAIDFVLENQQAGVASDCNATLIPFSVQSLTVGYAKDLSLLTYYAIRLSAKAKIFFSPFGDLDLKAYAAAQPFGSRIGPPDSYAQFTTSIVNSASTQIAESSNLTQQLPNLPIQINDSPAVGNGWDTSNALGTLYGLMSTPSPSGGTMPSSIDFNTMENAYLSVMAPNPWESNWYNIMNDLVSDPFVTNFTVQRGTALQGSGGVAAFWAPVFAPSANAQIINDQIQSDMNSIFNTNKGNNQGNTTVDYVSSLGDSLKQGFQQYLGKLQQGMGENSESNNIVVLTNPIPQNSKLGNASIFLTSPADMRTSWNDVNHQAFRDLGRVGYSVKFVSFDSLTKNRLKTDGATTSWTNLLNLSDPDIQSDVDQIKH